MQWYDDMYPQSWYHTRLFTLLESSVVYLCMSSSSKPLGNEERHAEGDRSMGRAEWKAALQLSPLLEHWAGGIMVCGLFRLTSSASNMRPPPCLSWLNSSLVFIAQTNNKNKKPKPTNQPKPTPQLHPFPEDTWLLPSFASCE